MREVQREMPEQVTKWELTEYEREGAWYTHGHAEGRVEAQRTSLLLVLANRNLLATPDERARIDACSDPEQLQRWFERALRVASVAEILDADD
ncbi:hypothetical protein ACNOYE_14655 [Nannocystaceae bacterium ST9]